MDELGGVVGECSICSAVSIPRWDKILQIFVVDQIVAPYTIHNYNTQYSERYTKKKSHDCVTPNWLKFSQISWHSDHGRCLNGQR